MMERSLFQLNEVDEKVILIQTISDPVNDDRYYSHFVFNSRIHVLIIYSSTSYLGYSRQDRLNSLKFYLVSEKSVNY